MGQDQPRYAVDMFQDHNNSRDNVEIQRRMTVDDKKLKKKDAFKQVS